MREGKKQEVDSCEFGAVCQHNSRRFETCGSSGETHLTGFAGCATCNNANVCCNISIRLPPTWWCAKHTPQAAPRSRKSGLVATEFFSTPRRRRSRAADKRTVLHVEHEFPLLFQQDLHFLAFSRFVQRCKCQDGVLRWNFL